jgi:hypothetical protein
VHARLFLRDRRATPEPGEVAGREATRKGCGVLVPIPEGPKLGTDPVDRHAVNVGSLPGWSGRPAGQPGTGRFGLGRAGRDVAEPS